METLEPRVSCRRIAAFFVSCVTLACYLFHVNATTRPAEASLNGRMLRCLRRVLHDELPLSSRQFEFQEGRTSLQVAYPHHYVAGNLNLWNEEIRFRAMKVLTRAPCSIWEVGANTDAADSRTFMNDYGYCSYHAYEPVPQYVRALRSNWASDNRLIIHEYGIGITSKTFHVTESSLRGQGTFLSVSTSSATPNSGIPITVKSFDEAVREAGGPPTLLHLNCEGCEWDLLFEGLETRFIQSIPVIQSGWHNYGDKLGTRVWQLCDIRRQLHRTHRLTSGVAFGWDRWTRRDLSD